MVDIYFMFKTNGFKSVTGCILLYIRRNAHPCNCPIMILVSRDSSFKMWGTWLATFIDTFLYLLFASYAESRVHIFTPTLFFSVWMQVFSYFSFSKTWSLCKTSIYIDSINYAEVQLINRLYFYNAVLILCAKILWVIITLPIGFRLWV